MSRTTFVLALAGALVAAPVLGAQQSQPSQQPSAAQQPPAGAPAPRRPMMGARRQGTMDRGMTARGATRRGRMGSGRTGSGRMGGGSDAAAMLLGRVGELKLTDQQVTRLAAITRRTHERRDAMRTAMRTRFDSLRAASPPAAGVPGTPGARRFAPSAPGAPGAAAPRAFAADMQRMRDQAHADLRDALAVLTPDQQALAWEAVSARAGSGRRAGRDGWRGAARGFGRADRPQRAPQDENADR